MSLDGKNLLVLSFSTIANDPRVSRQLAALSGRCKLTVAGYGRTPQGPWEFVCLPSEPTGASAAKLSRLLWLGLRRYRAYFDHLPQVAAARAALSGRTFDLIVCNDVNALPLALELARGVPVLLDAHEFSPREFEERLYWRSLHGPYLDYLCRSGLPRVQGFITVAEGIAAEYQAVYGVQAQVVHNTPRRAALQPSPVASERVRIVHHGAAMPARRIEAMIEAVEAAGPRFELDLMLVPGNARYLERLAVRAAASRTVRLVPPVSMDQIVPLTNRYDVGLYLLPPANFNNMHALPNKFFEFVQARLALAIGPAPEMRRLVERYECGIVSADFSAASMANALRELTPERLTQLKANSHRAAQELCWERSEPLFLEAVERALRARR